VRLDIPIIVLKDERAGPLQTPALRRRTAPSGARAQSLAAGFGRRSAAPRESSMERVEDAHRVAAPAERRRRSRRQRACEIQDLPRASLPMTD